MTILSPSAQSFISPHIARKWADQGSDQVKWALRCDEVSDEIARDIHAIRDGEKPVPENVTRYLYDKAAQKRRELAAEFGHEGQFGQPRTNDPLFTIMLNQGTYGSQYQEVSKRIEALADLDGKDASPGLRWRVERQNKQGLEVTTARLVDDEGRTMQTLQHLKAQSGKTLGDHIEQLSQEEHPEWHGAITNSGIAIALRKQTEGVLIIHTPGENVERLMGKADEAISSAVRGSEDKLEVQDALGKATWVLGIAAPLRGGSASTTDIVIKALMKANELNITPYRADALNWDTTAIVAPTQAAFAKGYGDLFQQPPSMTLMPDETPLPHKIRKILDHGTRAASSPIQGIKPPSGQSEGRY